MPNNISPSLFEQEILEQPHILQRLLDTEREHIASIASRLCTHPPRFIVIAARGTSDNAARYAQYLFGAYNRLPVALATPSLFTLYKSPPRLNEALVLAISQSGQSPDILAVVEEGRRQGALTLALTNDPASPLAERAELVIDLHAGPERSIAATKTYTASLLALALLSVALADDEERGRALPRVPEYVTQVLSRAEEVLQAACAYREITACVVLGRGYNYATAFEIALKLKELTYVLAEPYSTADFLHGPVALVENGFPVLAVNPQGKIAPEMTAFLRKLKARRPRLIVLSSLPEALALADTPLPLPPNVPEWLSPIVSVIPGQLFALGLALAKGLDPDHPRGLHKITRTR